MYFSLELIEETTNCSRYDFSFARIRELKELVMCRLLKRGIFLELLFTLLNLRWPTAHDAGSSKIHGISIPNSRTRL